MSNLRLNLIPCFDGTSVEKEGERQRERERELGGERRKRDRVLVPPVRKDVSRRLFEAEGRIQRI